MGCCSHALPGSGPWRTAGSRRLGSTAPEMFQKVDISGVESLLCLDSAPVSHLIHQIVDLVHHFWLGVGAGLDVEEKNQNMLLESLPKCGRTFCFCKTQSWVTCPSPAKTVAASFHREGRESH